MFRGERRTSGRFMIASGRKLGAGGTARFADANTPDDWRSFVQNQSRDGLNPRAALEIA